VLSTGNVARHKYIGVKSIISSERESAFHTDSGACSTTDHPLREVFAL
jgi:hypothetical protein